MTKYCHKSVTRQDVCCNCPWVIDRNQRLRAPSVELTNFQSSIWFVIFTAWDAIQYTIFSSLLVKFEGRLREISKILNQDCLLPTNYSVFSLASDGSHQAGPFHHMLLTLILCTKVAFPNKNNIRFYYVEGVQATQNLQYVLKTKNNFD